MKWQRARRSSNVDDRRGLSSGGAKMGLGGLVLVVIVGLFMGRDLGEMLGLVGQMGGGALTGGNQTAEPINDEASDFIAAILGETEDVWSGIFRQSGSEYRPPRLVLFRGQVTSACGNADSAAGPFYCPGDHQVYLDMVFFQEMERRLGGGGQFAEAYVIAHEVGHHIQTLTGVTQRVNDARRRGQNVLGAEGLLVRQELQADCYAGVWAHHAQRRHSWLEAGEIEQALRTASAIGDDTLQRQSRGTVVPDSFSHGTAEQRVRWFRTGFELGDANRCDTFETARL